MIALYLAMVLAGIIFGAVIGFAAPDSLFVDSHEDAMEWATECNAELDADFSFQGVINAILAPKSVIVNWREVNTPSLTIAAKELLEDWSNALSCQMDILALARAGDNTCETRQIQAPTKQVASAPIPTVPDSLPTVERAGEGWQVSWCGFVRPYTRKDSAQRGAKRMVARYIERGMWYALCEV